MPPEPTFYRLNRHLPAFYVALALPITLLLCFLTAPFFTPDEPHHAARAISLAQGFETPHIEAAEAGAPIDTAALHVLDAADTLRMAWEKQSPDFHNRHYGPMAAQTLPDADWASGKQSGTHTFAPFPNTAAYPPTLYLPAIVAWAAAPHLHLTILGSLRLARVLSALTAVALGWLALRLCAANRLLLLPFLLLPSTLFLNASCSQDAVLLSIAALVPAILTRPLVERRLFTLPELLTVTLLLILCATARPPYLAMALLLFLPALEHQTLFSRAYLPPTFALIAVAAASALWRHRVQPYGLDIADEADTNLQLLYLRHHPFAATAHLLTGTGQAASDFFHRGLYVIGWNDLLPPHLLTILLVIALLTLLLATPTIPLRSVTRTLLLAATAAPLLGISLAEYLIWTPPGHPTVYGIQPRYWLPLMPLATMLWPIKIPPRPWLLIPATTLLAAVACTLPWFAARAFYQASVLQVLHRLP